MRSLSIIASALLLAAAGARGAPLLFDMGTDRSAVWAAFTKVTETSVYSAAKGFGWQNAGGLKAYAEASRPRSERGDDFPTIWTNPITEAAVVGDRANTFLVKAGPGQYQVYLVCGASGGFRSQVFDFTVSVGGESRRVQIDGPYQFRTLRFRATVGQDPLAIRFGPRSKFVVNAVMAWRAEDDGSVRKEILNPFEEATYRMPPEERAKWKQDPEPDPGPLPPFSARDRARGFTVYSRHYLECIYPHSHPRLGEMNPELRMFASQGEYEPCTFAVYPLRDLKDARATVSALGPIPAGAVDVRHVRFMRARPNYTVNYRYRVVPDILEHFETLDLKAGENARFWLTVHVPENTPAGTYTGKATFTCSGGKAVVPIRMRVLPIHLREDPAKMYGIYYDHPYDDMDRAPDQVSREYYRHKAELQHQDMAAHGTRNIVLSTWSPAADAEGRFQFKWDLLAAKLELCRKYGFRGPYALEIPTEEVYAKYLGRRPGSHLSGVQVPPEAFSREMTAMVRTIEAARKARGWPEFLYYPIDEPSTEDTAIRFMVAVLKACKDAGVRTYVTADPTVDGFARLRPYVDVWCTQPFAPDRETVLADMKARQVEYWCYPNHVNGENDHTPVTGARMTYGFGFWRSGFVALIPWIYSASMGDPFNYLDDGAMDFFNRSEPDGTPMPVAMWEAYREGYDDYRYVYTLEQLIILARRTGNVRARAAAAAADNELKFVWNAIRVQPKYKDEGLWAPQDFDVYRWIIARQILRLQDSLSPRRPPLRSRTGTGRARSLRYSER